MEPGLFEPVHRQQEHSEAICLTDEWLASGISRARLLFSRSAGFGLVLTVACFASTLGISAVAPLVQSDPNLGGELGKALSMTVGLFCCYTIALLISQLPAERQTATAFSVGALVVLLVINGVADTVSSASWIGVVSPFHWMEATTSAAPGGTFDVGGTVGLALAAAVLLGLSLPVFGRRDIGNGLIGWGRRTHAVVRVASRNVMLRLPFTEGLWEQRVGLAVWAVSTLVLRAIMVTGAKSVADALSAVPNVAAIFTRAMGGNLYEGLMGVIWFGIALLVISGYAVVQVSRWAAQDSEGRVEMLVSAPVARTRIVIERALEFALASLVIAMAGYLGVAAMAPSSGRHRRGQPVHSLAVDVAVRTRLRRPRCRPCQQVAADRGSLPGRLRRDRVLPWRSRAALQIPRLGGQPVRLPPLREPAGGQLDLLDPAVDDDPDLPGRVLGGALADETARRVGRLTDIPSPGGWRRPLRWCGAGRGCCHPPPPAALRRLSQAEHVAVRVLHRRDQQAATDVFHVLVRLGAGVQELLQAGSDVGHLPAGDRTRALAMRIEAELRFPGPEADVIARVGVGLDAQQPAEQGLGSREVLGGIDDQSHPGAHWSFTPCMGVAMSMAVILGAARRAALLDS